MVECLVCHYVYGVVVLLAKLLEEAGPAFLVVVSATRAEAAILQGVSFGGVDDVAPVVMEFVVSVAGGDYGA